MIINDKLINDKLINDESVVYNEILREGRRFDLKIRFLEEKDAQYMYDWMHDDDVTEHLKGNFKEKTIQDCEDFITAGREEAKAFIESGKNSANLHLAVADDDDMYMGTVSLKHISYDNLTAEFAITVSRLAMGKGYAVFGMKSILKIGFDRGLEKIFWCVSEKNKRAVRFYDKNGYERTDDIPEEIKNQYADIEKELLWYCATHHCK